MKLLDLTVALWLGLLAFSASATADQTPSKASYVWLQMVGQDQASLRSISTAPCSSLTAQFQTVTRTFADRGPNTMNPGVPNVCEIVFDLTATTASTVKVQGHTIALPHHAPSRVVVLGDTGCRKDGSKHDQKCFPVTPAPKCDTESGATEYECRKLGWYFKAVADAAAKTAPDMIVHVGDYVYRDNCGYGRNKEGCHHQHQLREWSYWDSDFFSQAANILPTAPWVFVRGNHEDCAHKDRGWRGWSLFLSMQVKALKSDTNCITNQRQAAPTAIHFKAGTAPELTLLALDTADEATPSPSVFKKPLNGAKEAWVLTHVPLWYGSAYFAQADTLQLPAAMDMVISGHEHLFRMVIPTLQGVTGTVPATTGPLQILQGASGTKRDFNGPLYNYAPASAPALNYVNSDFSFTILDRKGNRTTDVILCTVVPDGTVYTHKAWTVSRGPNGMVSAPLVVPNDFCTKP